jgi:hypothetical protein
MDPDAAHPRGQQTTSAQGRRGVGAGGRVRADVVRTLECVHANALGPHKRGADAREQASGKREGREGGGGREEQAASARTCSVRGRADLSPR